MTEEEQIEEILTEADAYSLRWEVEQTTKRILLKNATDVKSKKLIKPKKITKLEATQIAFEEWVK